MKAYTGIERERIDTIRIGSHRIGCGAFPVYAGWIFRLSRPLAGFGALLVGVYEDKRLKFAGRVGTGYSDKLLLSLNSDLSKIPSMNVRSLIYRRSDGAGGTKD